MHIEKMRSEYHAAVCDRIIRFKKSRDVEYPNFADVSNTNSRAVATGIAQKIGCDKNYSKLRQNSGTLFEQVTRDYLEASFSLLQHVRPGRFSYSCSQAISAFDQYEHLASLEEIIENNKLLSSTLGTDYIVKPDVVIGRSPVSDDDLNKDTLIVTREGAFAKLTPLRECNLKAGVQILHASVSCKWTVRSDRSQNARTEALNLIRNRKGNLPHVVVVTAEPLPTRLASLALGTGDVDCVYHFALNEMIEALDELPNGEDQLEMANTLIQGRRLRDISDLPFDLAI